MHIFSKTPNRTHAALFRFAFLLFLMMFWAVSVQAKPADLFAVTVPPEPIEPGESFCVTLTPQTDRLAAFLLTAEYDGSIVSASAVLDDSLKADPVYTTLENDTLTVLYASAEGTMPKNAEITLTFRTAEDSSADSAVVVITLSDAADENADVLLTGQETHTVSASFRTAPSTDCALRRLIPSEGQLKPAFSPDIREYDLQVPFSCTAVTWETEAAEGASVRINRKNLGAGGSTTDFFLTVTAADGKSKSLYTVHVLRGDKPAATPKATPAASGPETSKPGSSKPESSVISENGAHVPTAEPEITPDIFTEAGVPAAADTPAFESVQNTETVLHTSVAQRGTDPLVIAAIALISAAAGMLLVLGVQTIFRKKDDDDR